MCFILARVCAALAARARAQPAMSGHDAPARAAEGLFLTAQRLYSGGERLAALQCAEACAQSGSAPLRVELRCRLAAAQLLMELECGAHKETKAHIDRALMLLGQESARVDAKGPITGAAKLANAALVCEAHALYARCFALKGNARGQKNALSKGLGVAARGGDALPAHADHFRLEIARLADAPASARDAFAAAAEAANAPETRAHAQAAAAHCAVLAGDAHGARQWLDAEAQQERANEENAPSTSAPSPTAAYARLVRCVALLALGETDHAAQAVAELREGGVGAPSLLAAVASLGLPENEDACESLVSALEAAVEEPRTKLPEGRSADALVRARATAERAIRSATGDAAGALCGPPALRSLLCHVLEAQARQSITCMQLSRAQTEALALKASVALLPAGARARWAVPLQALSGLYLHSTGAYGEAAEALRAAAAAGATEGARSTYTSLAALALVAGGESQAAREALDGVGDDAGVAPPVRAVALLARATVATACEGKSSAGRDKARTALELARSPLQSHQLASAALRALSSAALADGDAGHAQELASSARALSLGHSDSPAAVASVGAIREACAARRDDAGETQAARAEARKEAEVDAAVRMAGQSASDHAALCDWRDLSAVASSK